MGMTNLEWLYEHDEYFNSFAKLMACLRGFSTDEFTANEWLRQEHSEPNPDCSAMLYKTFTENMKHEPCSDYEPKDDAVSIMRECAETGHSMRVLRGRLGVECVTGWQARCLGKLADMVERDYVRRDAIEEVMDNDRALVEENAKLASELEAAKLQIGQSNAPKSAETAENDASKDDIRDFDDSREKLEADVRKHYSHTTSTSMYPPSANKQTDWLAPMPMDIVFGWLDRQAEITFEEAEANCKECFTETYKRERKLGEAIDGLTERVDELKAERNKLRSQICKLEDDLVGANDERDNWKANCEDWKKDCERYRALFGKALDYADEIIMLGDEGAA